MPELLAGIDWAGQPKRVSVGQLVHQLIASECRLRHITIDLMVTVAGLDDFSICCGGGPSREGRGGPCRGDPDAAARWRTPS